MRELKVRRDRGSSFVELTLRGEERTVRIKHSELVSAINKSGITHHLSHVRRQHHKAYTLTVPPHLYGADLRCPALAKFAKRALKLYRPKEPVSSESWSASPNVQALYLKYWTTERDCCS